MILIKPMRLLSHTEFLKMKIKIKVWFSLESRPLNLNHKLSVFFTDNPTAEPQKPLWIMVKTSINKAFIPSIYPHFEIIYILQQILCSRLQQNYLD